MTVPNLAPSSHPAAAKTSKTLARAAMPLPGANGLAPADPSASGRETVSFGSMLSQFARGLHDGQRIQQPPVPGETDGRAGDAPHPQPEQGGTPGGASSMGLWLAMPQPLEGDAIRVQAKSEPTPTPTVDVSKARKPADAAPELVPSRALSVGEIDRGSAPDVKAPARLAVQAAPDRKPGSDASPLPSLTPAPMTIVHPPQFDLHLAGVKPDPASPAAPAQSAMVPQGFDVTQAQRAPDGRVTRLTVSVRPEGLGELAVSLRQVDGRLELDIRAGRDDVAEHLAADPSELLGAIADLLPAARSVDVRISTSDGAGSLASWRGAETGGPQQDASAGQRRDDANALDKRRLAGDASQIAGDDEALAATQARVIL